MAERLTGVDVGEVNFDHRQRHGAKRIVDGDRGVRIGARVDDDGVETAQRLLDPGDQFAFDIGLLAGDLETERLAFGNRHLLDVGKRLRAVGLGLAGPEHVEVRAVENKDAVSHGSCLLHWPPSGRKRGAE